MPNRARKKKLIDVIRWLLGADSVNEDYCTTICKAVRKQKTQCAACPKPVLLPANLAVFELFMVCFSQFRLDMYGNRSIDYSVVHITASMMDTVMTPSLFEKFRTMEREYLNIIEVERDGGKE